MEPYHEKLSKVIEYYEREVIALTNSLNGLVESKDKSLVGIIGVVRTELEAKGIILKKLKNEEIPTESLVYLDALVGVSGLTDYVSKKQYIDKDYGFLHDAKINALKTFIPTEVDKLTLQYINELETKKKNTFVNRLRLSSIARKVK